MERRNVYISSGEKSLSYPLKFLNDSILDAVLIISYHIENYKR
jgi:hypothetical protein